MKQPKAIIVLGSTGSVGLSTLEVVREHPADFKVVALAACSSDEKIADQVREFRPEAVCLADPEAAARFEKKRIGGVRVFSGPEGTREVAKWKSGNIVVAASSGSSALVPVLDAIRAGKDIALANKEILVMAGGIIMREVRQNGVCLLPVDSEHNAIFQCLGRERIENIRRILLTGSGGPLRDVPVTRFKGISKDVVIHHPKWSMGKKISVDSATLMNKGLEMIEAHWLFGVGCERIKIMIHPEAVVHSMVEFIDGSVIAQMGPTDMKSPLLHALSYPERLAAPAGIDLAKLGLLHFYEPDFDKFPCLEFAVLAAQNCDSTLPCVLSAADEIAVEAFLNDRIDFTEIPIVIEKVLKNHRGVNAPRLGDVQEADRWARTEALRFTTGAVPSGRL